MALPRFTWRRAALELLCTIAFAWYCRHHAAPPYSMAFWGIFISILTGIWHGFQAAGSVVIAALQTAVTWLKSRLFDLARVLGSGIAFVGKGVANLGEAIAHAISNGVVPAFQQLYRWAREGFTFLQKIGSQTIEWIQRARGYVLALYRKYVRPIVDAIDHVRRGFHILASLGIDAAAAVERRLADVEHRITQPVLDIVGKLNEAINVVNRIVTLNGLIQKITLFGSLFQYRAAFVNFSIRQIATPKLRDLAPPLPPKAPALSTDDAKAVAAVTLERAQKGIAAATPDDLLWLDDVIARVRKIPGNN